MIARAFVAKFTNVVPKYVTLFDINLGNEEGGLKVCYRFVKFVKGSLWIAG